MLEHVDKLLGVPPVFTSAVLLAWSLIVATSVAVYGDLRRHGVGPTSNRKQLTPGAIAACVLWFTLIALFVYVIMRQRMIRDASPEPSAKSGLILYIVWLVIYTAVFPIIAAA